jgi:uncharacterized membrane-anchored protein YhcB (DUF1043 family)
MSETILMVLGAIGLLVAGGGLGFWLAQARMRSRAARADEIREQFDDYRREVTQHFGRTAEHFKAIGREYRELYEHMASGADSLCDREAADVKLSFAPKTILESIAEEQPPEPPRDFEQAEHPPEAAPPTPDEQAAARPDEEPVETLKSNAEAEPVETVKSDAEKEPSDKAPRTLH